MHVFHLTRLLNTRCSALHMPRRFLFVPAPLYVPAPREEERRRRRPGARRPRFSRIAQTGADWKLLARPGHAGAIVPGRWRHTTSERPGPAGRAQAIPPPAEPGRFPPGRALTAGPGPGSSPPARPRRCPGAKGGLSPPTPPRFFCGVLWFLFCAGVGICSEINK